MSVYRTIGPLVIFRGVRSNFFIFISFFSMKFMSANRKAPEGMPHFTASHDLGLFCLPISHKKGRQANMG